MGAASEPRAHRAALLCLALSLPGFTSCQTGLGLRRIALGDDPNVPANERLPVAPELFTVAWEHPLVKLGLLEYQPSETATPAVDPESERVIVSTRDGVTRCLSPVDGREEWTFKTNGRPFAGATVADGVVYLPAGDGALYALKVTTGETIWSFHSGEELVTVPVVTDELVIVASQSETVFAVSRDSGKWAWQYRRDAPSGFTIRGAARPAVRNDQVYAGFADGTLVVLSLADGVAKWERKLTVSGGTQFLDVDTTPVFDGKGHVFAASYKDGIYSLDETNGDVRWHTARAGVTTLLVHDGQLFAAGDGYATALDAATGSVAWSVDLSDRTSKGRLANTGRTLATAQGYLLVPTSTALALLDPTTGGIWTMWNPGRGVTAAPGPFNSSRYGPRMFVLSNYGTIYALDFRAHGG